jgi:deoxycytidine triphosphate deaminase
MSVLSDTTIRERLSSLVPNGRIDDAKHCAYEFTAEKVFKGSAAAPVLVSDDSPVIIEPTELVWVRAKEEINVPANCVGLWVPTQTLSRKGLLLLNQSLVEPGYCGPLHAVFANFGRTKVIINSGTKIAKVMFLELNKGAENLVTFDTSAYDNSILEISANAPDSFMELSSLAPSLKTEGEEQLRMLKVEARALQADIVASAKDELRTESDKRRTELRKEIDDQKSDMTERVKSVALRWGGATAAGLLLGVGLVWLSISVYLPRLAASYADVDGIARRAVQERGAALDKASIELRANHAELDAVKQEIETLKQELNAQKKTSPLPTSGLDNKP